MKKPDKGKIGGSCNRTACQAPGATWFNTSTRAYYCEPCARDITDFTKRAEGFHICFPSTGDAEQDRAMKFGVEPEPRRPTPDEFFGGAAQKWRDALNALHDFAQASECGVGLDVIGWFADRTKAFQAAPPEPRP